MNRWPHQARAFESVLDAIAQGQRRICLTSPTGGGKTVIASDLARHYLEQGKKVVLYTNRKMLVDQTSRVLTAAGHDHGVRAAGYAEEHYFDLQVSSVQTEASRVLKRKTWKLHDAELVIVDEAHLQTQKTARKLLDAHHEAGAAYVGLTATPLDLCGLYEHLIVAGTNSALRACGALVKCLHYGPDEPDLRHIGKVPLGEDLTEKQNIKAIMVNGIFGRVYEWWKRLNPDARPTILFAPGVAESIWFAEQFHKEGVRAASIDGEDIWLDGNFYKSSREARDEVMEGSKDGQIRILCNRFVLREGIDAPWLAHGILATVFGSLQSYLQSGGRLLRAFPGIGSITLQDHGGNWWRHGSLNADREWRLDYTSGIVTGLREQAFREKKEKEPCCCPQCGLILAGLKCPCGFEVHPGRRSRLVVQSDGSLIAMNGDIFKQRRITKQPNAEKIWERIYYRAKNSRNHMTFRQAEALFAYENQWGWPPHTFKFMPVNELDWFRAVKDVPLERLVR